jgi:hypothetical protein
MSPAHRAPRKVTRRHVIGGLAALAAVPAAVLAIRGIGADETHAEATSTPTPSPSPSASPTPETVTSGGGTVPFTPGRAMLGSYLGLEGKSLGESLALRKRQLGRDQRIVHVFYDFEDPLPSAIEGLPAKATPMVSWRGCPLSEITSGASDALIARAARQLRRMERPVLLRWAWEMNGDWYAWSADRNNQDGAVFVTAWRRLHRIFAEQKATNVSWVWSPNWNSAPVAAWNTFAALYPGDKYVDWVGVSGYNLHRETPDTLFDPIYDDFAARKPLMITEIGAVDRGGRTKADWITLVAAWIEAHPAVGAMVWFDTDTHPGFTEKWRIDTDAASLAAYQALAASARFGG